MGIVREAFLNMIRDQNTLQSARHEVMARGEEKRLWVSDLGKCKRKPFLRLAGVEETHAFDEYTLELFHSGRVWENQIQEAFSCRLMGTPVTDLEIKMGIWSGRIDMYLPDINAVVELKDTADHNFRARDRLPYVSHALQSLAYSRLLRQKWGLDSYPSTILYYHGRGSWAELHLQQFDEGLLYAGERNGKDYSGSIPYNVDTEMADFEALWKDYEGMSVLPDPPYSTPFEERFACLKAVKDLWYPACNYLGSCWSALMAHQPPWDQDEWPEGYGAESW